VSEISKEAWTEARREMLEMSNGYSNGHKTVRMDTDVYDFILSAREAGLPWNKIFQIMQKNGLTKYKMHESLQRAWRDETQLREVSNAAR